MLWFGVGWLPTLVLAAELPDFRPGSHERFIEEVENGQTREYRRVVAAYREAMEEQPDNALLAVEGLRFVQFFYYSEDLYIEESESDHEAFSALLDERFPQAPPKILLDLESSWGDEFDHLKERYEGRVAQWSEAERAQFEFLVAQHRQWDGQTALALGSAQSAFELHPTLESGLLLAEIQQALGRREECRATLAHELLAGGDAWDRKRVMDLYFALEAKDEARAVYEELCADPDYLVSDEDTFHFFLAMGDLPAARETLYGVELNEWNSAYELRRRLDFELEHGDFAAADQAYQNLRETGWTVDPFLRQRLALFWKYREVSVHGSDWMGILILVVVLAFAFLLPLFFVLPVHYWGLLRERAGREPSLDLGGPGLRACWAVLALATVVQLAALWTYHPSVMESWVTDEPAMIEPEVSFAQALSGELANVVLLLVMLLFVARRRAWKLFGNGHLETAAGLGTGVASWIGFKIAVLLIGTVWGAIWLSSNAQGAPLTEAHLRALYTGGGSILMIGAVAGLTPVVEELCFRGFLLGAGARHIPFFWANVGQATLFASVHEDQGLFLFYLGFGMVAGYLTKAARGLAPAIVFHAMNNLVASAFLLVGWR